MRYISLFIVTFEVFIKSFYDFNNARPFNNSYKYRAKNNIYASKRKLLCERKIEES